MTIFLRPNNVIFQQLLQFNKFYIIKNKSKRIKSTMTNDQPLYLQNVFTFKNLPVQEKQRKWTDCCCTFATSLFAVLMLILSFIVFTKNNYYQVNFPADDLGKTCYNQLKQYPYLYFHNPSDPTQGRYCLKTCPKSGNLINCQKNSNSGANCASKFSNYDTTPQINKIGAFCSPSDESVRNRLFSQAELGQKMYLTHGYDMIKFSLLMGILMGLLYLALVGCLAKWATLFSFAGAFLVLVAAGLYIMLRPVNLFSWGGWTILLGSLLILIGIAQIFYLIFYRKELQLVSIFILHSNSFLKQSYFVYLYIPLFLILTIVLLGLIFWQYVAFGTAYYPTFQRSNIYYHSGHNVFLQAFNVFELIFGLQFLRDSFNFVVSGNSIEWYFKTVTQSRHCTKPFVRLFSKHWGSVVGGSFLNAFFKIFDIFADCFNCNPRGEFGKCQTTYQRMCCCNYLFQLIRSDSYSYINLTGIPYCNAARQCEALCKYSSLINKPHSCLRIFRNAAHIAAIGLASLLSYITLACQTSQYGGYDQFWVAAAIVYVCYSMTTYFVDIHQNGAQGIMISYLTEQNCEGEFYIEVCPGELRKDLYNYKITLQSQSHTN